MSLSRSGILNIVQVVSKEKGISAGVLLELLEQAIATVSREKYGEHKFKCHFDRKTGEISLFICRMVVKSGEEKVDGISIEQLKQDGEISEENISEGDEVLEKIPIFLDTGAIRRVRNMFLSGVKKIEVEKEYNAFKNRIGELVSGVVEKFDGRRIFVNLSGGVPAIMNKDEKLAQDVFPLGSKISGCIVDVKLRLYNECIIYISRTKNQYLIELFKREVPEIYSGEVEIVAVVREPGSCSKVAVHSRISSINPIHCCIGPGGERIKAVRAQVAGERIGIVQWENNLENFIISAISPIIPNKIVIEEGIILVLLRGMDIHSVIGRGGQNIRLLSKLVQSLTSMPYVIKVRDVEKYSFETTEKSKKVSSILQSLLDIDEMLAQLLISEGYSSIRKIASTELEELGKAFGGDKDIAEELVSRAKLAIEANETNSDIDLLEEMEKGGEAYGSQDHEKYIEQDDKQITERELDMTLRALSKLKFDLYKVAALSIDELDEYFRSVGYELPRNLIEKLIIKARDKAYFDVMNDKPT